MRWLSLGLALLLCAAASTTVAAGAPWQLTVICVGAFLLFTPGLLLTSVVRLPDRLLSLVVGLLVGPCLWVLIATLQAFAGLWAPRLTVLLAAGLLGLVVLGLAARGVRLESAAGGGRRTSGTGPSVVEEYAVEDPDSPTYG